MSSNPEKNRRPTIAITVGDVSGVGPELALRCCGLPEVADRCLPILYGPGSAIRTIARAVDLPMPQIHDVGMVNGDALKAGQFSAETGKASFEAVEKAVADAVAGKIDAIVTGPIQKEAWHMAGIEFPGHTEMLAARLDIEDFCMMLTSNEISCVLATIHIPLADVPVSLTTESVLRAIRLGADAMTTRNGNAARVTVCGLNPHAGENGMLSHGEELDIIQPAIDRARAEGLDVRGPLAPDTAFVPAIRATTDVYVCMYHDQGLIPLKTLAFEDAVNVTLGLPIVRTSVDHGTALDLAWKGTASHRSMLAAIELAIDLSNG